MKPSLRIRPFSTLALGLFALGPVGCGGSGGGGPTPPAPDISFGFADRTDIPISGTGSADFVLADLDGDGQRDLVSANRGSDLAEVFRNLGGLFQAVIQLGGCPDPFDVEVADLDGDGDPDIVVSCRGDGKARIFFGEVGLSFSAQPVEIPISPLLGGLVEIKVGEVTGDANPDLLALDMGTSNIFLVPGLGGRTFGLPVAIPKGAFPAAAFSSLGLGDLDGDGDLDLVASDLDFDRVVVFTGNGSGGFAASFALPTDSYPISVTLADRDDDGDLDILTANYIAENVSFWDNDGLGTFASGSNLGLFGAITDVQVFDLDGDGIRDLLAASFGTSSIEYARGNGSGGYAAPVQQYGVGFRPRRLQAADVDGNGAADILSANFEEPAFSLIENDPVEGLNAARNYYSGPFPYYITCENFDAEAGYEVICANLDQGALTFHDVDAQGTLSLIGTFAVPIHPNYIAPLDADGDGDLDLAISDARGSAVIIVFNDGVLPFNRLTTIQTSSLFPVQIAVGDVDGDQDLDLMVASSGTDTLVLLTNDGSGGYTETGSFAVGQLPSAVLLVDLDRDGDLDAVSSDHGDDTVTILSNDGNGGFSFARTAATRSEPTYITSGDMNADALPDLIVACAGEEHLRILTNLGGLQFQSSDHQVGAHPNFIEVRFLNGGQLPDLLVMLENGNANLLVNNDRSPGSLILQDSYTTARDTTSAVMRDLNGDGLADLIVSSYHSVKISVSLAAPKPVQP